MKIRTYQPGDDAAQVSIYNEAAADLPRLKPAALDEVRRRNLDPTCSPAGRFLAVEGDRPVGYISFQTTGRLSYPWCRKGYEAAAEPLFEHAIAAMKQHGLHQAFTAYRSDWTAVLEFFKQHGFEQKREMINYLLDITDMPTPAVGTRSTITPLTADDLPALLEMSAGVVRTQTAAELETYLFRNPYFPPESVFALRQRSGGPPVAVAILVVNPSYANPKQVDSAMPCFRLGAFGTEGMTTKRINGLFSFLTGPGKDVSVRGLDLLGHAAMALHDTEVETFAAQVPSDAPHLGQLYHRYFRRQGSFPILERTL